MNVGGLLARRELYNSDRRRTARALVSYFGIEIIIKTLSGRSFSVKISPECTVYEMKLETMKKSGIPPSHVRYILNGKVLDSYILNGKMLDSCLTLEECGLYDRVNIYMVIRI